ncbi:MAG: RluA family pseudouridine synthase [Verrucomicrobiota bacterium]
MSGTWSIKVEITGASERLDRYLPAALGVAGFEASRSQVQDWIRDGLVTVESRVVKPRFSLEGGELIEVRFPEESERELSPEPIALTILHEDEDIIVIDKPSGMVVHPGSGNERGTLVAGLLHHTGGRLSHLADPDRPGIVHRLDKDTSGCLVAAKSDRAYESLVAQFSGRETSKRYLAVTLGIPQRESGRIESQIGRHPVQRQRMAILEPSAGKEAITDYKVIQPDPEGEWAALECVIHTGRTHQIRVHLKEALRCPILGDAIYGRKGKGAVAVERLMLHARELGFRHPESGDPVSFESLLPEPFLAFFDPNHMDF